MEKYLVFIAPALLLTVAFLLLLISSIKAKQDKTRKARCTNLVNGEVAVRFKHKSKGYTPCYLYQVMNHTFFCYPSLFDPRYAPLAYRSAVCDPAFWTSEKYLDSIHIASKAKYSWHSKYTVGSSIPIQYDPADPKTHYIPEDDIITYTTSGIRITETALLAAGVLALMIAIFVVMGIIPQR